MGKKNTIDKSEEKEKGKLGGIITKKRLKRILIFFGLIVMVLWPITYATNL